MRHKWLMPILMLLIAFVVVACGPTGPEEEPGVAAPTEIGETDGDGLEVGDETAAPEVGVETSTPEAGMTAAVTPEVEATAVVTTEVDATPVVTPEVETTPMVTPEVEATTAITPETGLETAEPVGEAGINEVTFIGTEYAFDGPDSIPAGWTRITFENQGTLAHDLQPVWLEEGRTLDDVMTALAGDGPPDWVRLYGGVSAQPGETETFLVNLDPGNYVLLSFGEAETGLPDAAQGMIAQLTVTESDTTTMDVELPEADAEIELVDFEFAVEGEISSGEQLLHVFNTGTELHELIVFRLREGNTMEDVQAALEQEMAGEQIAEEDLPMDFSYGTQLSPGVEMYATYDFEPGSYVFICFIPSPENNMTPHYELGMIDEVIVE